MGYGTHIGKVAKENEMRELVVQINLLVSTADDDSLPKICVKQSILALAIAGEVGLADSNPEQFKKVQQILESIDPQNVDKEVLRRLDEELRNLTGIVGTKP
jgi:hypothetical protein